MIHVQLPQCVRCCQPPQPGRASLGYAAGGPADRTSAAWANATLGNDLQAPIMECTLAANSIVFESDTQIAWAGAPFAVSIDEHTLPPPRQKTAVLAGQTVRLQPGPWGARVYLAVLGGWQTSRAAQTNQATPTNSADIGSTMTYATDLNCAPVNLPDHRQLLAWLPRRGHLRVTEAPETPVDWHPTEIFRVSTASNAHGIRFTGPAPELETYDILSGPVIDGTIQATPDGLIALLRDRQTVGGYPRIAQIIPSDVDLAAQLRPGDAIHIDVIDLATSHSITKAYQDSFHALRNQTMR
jgi:antagonist of KipI